ncbi:MAG: GumC family protein, partial [Nitratireductor sp.]|nr:GumC family protein [Nitratireductor sp.]
MSGSRDLNADVDIDIMGLMSEVWKRRWLILALTLLTGVALLFALSFVEPRYKSSARILIEKRESVFTRRADSDYSSSGSQFDEQAIGSQVQVLGSDDIALKVIDSLGLADRKEFTGSAEPSFLDNVLISLGMKSQVVADAVQSELLKAFHKRLSVYAAEKSRVLVVEFWSYDSELAQSVPNAIANEYLQITKQAKLDANVEATDWLGPEIEELRTKVRDAEAKVAEFRSSSDILVGNNNALLSTQQLSEASSELSRLRADRSAVEAKAQSIQAALKEGGSLDAIPEVIASPLIQRLRERQVALQAEISELSTTLLPNHPRIKALRSQLADFDAQIRMAARDIQRSLENNVGVVRAQETVLLKEIDRLKAEAARVGEAEVELRALEREAAAQRELLESYLTQYREAASRQNREYLPVDARIISRAVRPAESYFPKVVPFAIAGMVTMVVLSVVGVLAWALMSGRAFKPVGAMPADFVPERVVLPEIEPYDADERYGDDDAAGRPGDDDGFDVSPPFETEIAPGPKYESRSEDLAGDL